jgi:hypothetical protein
MPLIMQERTASQSTACHPRQIIQLSSFLGLLCKLFNYPPFLDLVDVRNLSIASLQFLIPCSSPELLVAELLRSHNFSSHLLMMILFLLLAAAGTHLLFTTLVCCTECMQFGHFPTIQRSFLRRVFLDAPLLLSGSFSSAFSWLHQKIPYILQFLCITLSFSGCCWHCHQHTPQKPLLLVRT